MNKLIYLFIFLIASNDLLSQTIKKIIPGETKDTKVILPAGNANISIPVFVPPGTNGMLPDPIALNFNSPGGNATLGKGGTLQGISFITRGPRTLSMDGRNRPVQIDAGDVFIDNGNPLVCVSGTNGRNNAEYRTRNETFAKYISFV